MRSLNSALHATMIALASMFAWPETAKADDLKAYEAVSGPLFVNINNYIDQRIKHCINTIRDEMAPEREALAKRLRELNPNIDPSMFTNRIATTEGQVPEDEAYCRGPAKGMRLISEYKDLLEDYNDERNISDTSYFDEDAFIDAQLELFSINEMTSVELRKKLTDTFFRDGRLLMKSATVFPVPHFYDALSNGIIYAQYTASSYGNHPAMKFKTNKIIGALAIRQNPLLDWTAPVGDFRFDARDEQYPHGDFFVDKSIAPGFGPFLALRLASLRAQAELAEGRLGPAGAANHLRQAYKNFEGDLDVIGTRLQLRSLAASENERASEKRRNLFANFASAIVGIVAIKAELDVNSVLRLAQAPLDIANRQTEVRQQLIAELRQRWVDATPQAQPVTDDGVRMAMVRITRSAHGTASPTENPIQNVVRLRMTQADGRTGFCTGSLIEGNRVLTAQHCIRDELGAPKRIDSIQWEYNEFCRHQTDGYSLCPTGKSLKFGQVVTADGSWKEDWRNDWAVISLDENLTGLGFEPAKVADMRDPAVRQEVLKSRIITAGYSSDLNSGREITVHWGCGAIEAQKLIEYRCNSWKGNSGGPIFLASGPLRGQVIGVTAFAKTRPTSTGQVPVGTSNQGGGPSSAIFYEAAH